jgi:hypothetical protein
MNRHTRRAQATAPAGSMPAEIAKALATINSLQEFASVAEKLKPFLANAEQLSARLDEAREALVVAQEENSALRAELLLQRQIFLRMFAQGMGLPLTEVLSMEESIQGQLAIDDNPSPEPIESAAEAPHPGA